MMSNDLMQEVIYEDTKYSQSRVSETDEFITVKEDTK